jgi:hypothetical protein
MEKGKTYIMFIPPSWTIAGTLVDIEPGVAPGAGPGAGAFGGVGKFNDCIYIESVADGVDTIGAVSRAASPDQLASVIGRCWSWGDGAEVALGYVVMAKECKITMQSQARKGAADTVRKAASK